MITSRPLILSFGSVNIDLTARTAHLPRPGETVHAHGYSIGLGGKGANQAAAAGRLARALHLDVAFAGRVGDDPFGVQAHAALTAFGVDLTALHTDPSHSTGIALIGIDDQAENCITVAGGTNLEMGDEDVARAAPFLARASVLLLQLEIPQTVCLSAARLARAGGGRVVLDPAPAPEHGLLADLWDNIDIITPNEHETGRLTGIVPQTVDDAKRAATILMERGAKAALIKMGARGVYWANREESGFVPPFAVNAIDTVAAGDCFNAGLATAIAQGRTLGEATRMAAACGALATTRSGAADAAPEWAEVSALLG